MPASLGKIYGYPGANVWKAQVAAKYNGLEVEFVPVKMGVDNKTPEFLAKFPLGKVPTFEGADGLLLNESNAIAYYVASAKEGTTLLGKDKKEAALVQSFVHLADNELAPVAYAWLYPIWGYAAYDEAALKRAKENVKRTLAYLNKHLSTRTFLVGDRVTLADIVLCLSLSNFYKSVFEPSFIAEFVHVNRWFLTVVAQPNVKSVVGTFEFCSKAAVYDAKAIEAARKKEASATPAKEKKEEKKAEKKAEKKPAAEDLEAIAAAEEKAAAKEKNPLDLLPKSPFVLDEWKRFYSNNDTRPTAVDWFWKNFDAEGWSIWKVDYKYNNELTQVFMSSNLIGGFFQRLERARKYAFGSMLVLGQDGKNEITGYFVLRGQDVIFEVTDSADYESFSFVKVNPKDAKVREDVNAVFAWDEKIRGKPCADGKVFK